MDNQTKLTFEQNRTFNLSELDLDEDSDFDNMDFDNHMDSPEDLQATPVLMRCHAIKPEKIIHENIGNMTRKQIMAQTRAALDDQFNKTTFVINNIDYKEPSIVKDDQKWTEEITESIKENENNIKLQPVKLQQQSISLKDKLKHISNELGPLSMLIFTRLERYYQIMLNGTHQSDHQLLLNAEAQLKLNPSGYIGIPTRSDKFMKFITERMAKIIFKSKQASDDISIKINDLVFPSIEEISKTISSGFVNKNEICVYKLILDFYESLSSSKSYEEIKKSRSVITSAMQLYESITDDDFENIKYNIAQLEQSTNIVHEQFWIKKHQDVDINTNQIIKTPIQINNKNDCVFYYRQQLLMIDVLHNEINKEQ